MAFHKHDAYTSWGKTAHTKEDIDEAYDIGTMATDPLTMMIAEEEHRQSPEYLRDILDCLPPYQEEEEE